MSKLRRLTSVKVELDRLLIGAAPKVGPFFMTDQPLTSHYFSILNSGI